MHTRTAAAAIAAALLLTACSSPDTPKAKPTPTRAPSDTFLGAVVDHPVHSWDDGHGPTQTELLAYPPRWCAALKQGHSVDYLLTASKGGLYPSGTTWGTRKADAQRVLLMAVEAYCPAHRSRVQAELRESGDY